MLSRIDWADFTQNGSIDDYAEYFNTIFFEAACNCMPVKTVTIRSKDAAWINADIRWAIKQKYTSFKKAKRSNKDEDWRAYRTCRNLVTRFMRFCNNKIMLLWVKTRILTFWIGGGRGGTSITVTTRHVTASQNWVQNKPKILLWHSDTKNQ